MLACAFVCCCIVFGFAAESAYWTGCDNFSNSDFTPLELLKLPTEVESGKILAIENESGEETELLLHPVDSKKYEIVEYIEGNTNAYIDSGLVINKRDTGIIQTDIQYLEDDARWDGANQYLQYYYGYVNSFDRVKMSIEYNLHKQYWEYVFINGNLKYKYSRSSWNEKVYCDSKIGVLANGSFKNTWWVGRGESARLFGENIILNGELRRVFIPVINKASGEAGLYDAITDSFFANVSTGRFNTAYDDVSFDEFEQIPSLFLNGDEYVQLFSAEKSRVDLDVDALDGKQPGLTDYKHDYCIGSCPWEDNASIVEIRRIQAYDDF